jgi:hypothetical protein
LPFKSRNLSINLIEECEKHGDVSRRGFFAAFCFLARILLVKGGRATFKDRYYPDVACIMDVENRLQETVAKA